MTEHECCEIAATYRQSGRRDIDELKKASLQHQKNPFEIEKLRLVLQSSPELVEAWELWSDDKRWTPAWYFGTVANEKWVVGFHGKDAEECIETEFDDRFEACASFIQRELEDYSRILDSETDQR